MRRSLALSRSHDGLFAPSPFVAAWSRDDDDGGVDGDGADDARRSAGRETAKGARATYMCAASCDASCALVDDEDGSNDGDDDDDDDDHGDDHGDDGARCAGAPRRKRAEAHRGACAWSQGC